eukprot:scaffold932_cov328-Pavlova_lutheri.AAC.47
MDGRLLGRLQAGWSDRIHPFLNRNVPGWWGQESGASSTRPGPDISRRGSLGRGRTVLCACAGT